MRVNIKVRHFFPDQRSTQPCRTTAMFYSSPSGRSHSAGRHVALRHQRPTWWAGKRCHLQVEVDGSTDVVVEDTEVNLSIAIDRATGRAGRNLVCKN